jgi:prepilin-type N-terminal cleavage/methylation domain-containing protein
LRYYLVKLLKKVAKGHKYFLKTYMKRGFTLIEILIVVAIIAILASVVLVGLGPTQQAGRDARRLSDLRSVQNALELFYSKCGFYPGTAAPTCTAGAPGGDWTSLSTAIKGATIGVSSIPSDPSSDRTYAYGYNSGNSQYVIATALENANNSVVKVGYTAPDTTGIAGWVKNSTTITPATDCTSVPTGGTGATYCLTL